MKNHLKIVAMATVVTAALVNGMVITKAELGKRVGKSLLSETVESVSQAENTPMWTGEYGPIQTVEGPKFTISTRYTSSSGRGASNQAGASAQADVNRLTGLLIKGGVDYSHSDEKNKENYVEGVIESDVLTLCYKNCSNGKDGRPCKIDYENTLLGQLEQLYRLQSDFAIKILNSTNNNK